MRFSGRELLAALGRNTVVSCGVFLVGLAVLWVLVDMFGVQQLVAVAISFLVANSLHYAIGRLWIYPDSDQGLARGFFYFLVNAGIGLVLTVAFFALLTDLVGMHFLIARAVASLFAGLAAFLLNALLNFRSVARRPAH
jgi:putative flippase GtrA